jgi:hypothetical protein
MPRKVNKDPDAIDAPATDDVPEIQLNSDTPETGDKAPVSVPDPKEAPVAASAPETPAAAAPAAEDEPEKIDEALVTAFFPGDKASKRLQPLSPEEEADRAVLEDVVHRGIATFVETGRALLEISGRRLYRNTHKTFQAYVVETFRFRRNQAYDIMRATATAELVESADLDVETPSIRAAGELSRIDALLDTTDLTPSEIETFTRAMERFALELAVEVAPKDPHTGKAQLSQKLLQSVKEVMADAARFHAVEIEGEQHAVSAAAIAITRDVFEAMQRERQRWIDELRARDARLNTPIAAPPSHREIVTDDTPKPTVDIRCSIHGKTDLREFKVIFGGFVLSCGCKWRRIEGEDYPTYQGNELAQAAAGAGH